MLGPVSTGKEQRAKYSGSHFIKVAVLLKLGLSPSRVEEADGGRICETTGVGVGVTARFLAQPTPSTVQQHTPKLWVLWHCWARIEATVGTSSLLQPRPNSAVLLDGRGAGGWAGGKAVNRWIELLS